MARGALTDDTLAYTFVVEDANGEFLIKSAEERKNNSFLDERIELERFTDSEACIRVMMLGNPVACRCVWNLFQNESGIIKAERSEKVLRREEKFKGQRYLLNAVKSENCKDLVKDLTNYAVLVSPGPHIIMILMTAGHNPSEVLNDIIAVHGNDIEKYVLLVFLNSLNGSASEEDEIRHVFATDAKRRKTNYIFLNTRDMDNTIPKQMNSLLEKIEDVTKNNDMTYYTHKIFDQTEVEIQNALKEKESRQHLDNLHMKRKEIDEELMLIQEPEIAHRKEKLREQIVLKSLKIILEGNENLQAG
ncbi:GTPase IMAP family member 4-like [Mytilus edulis]|uniref:GTPase IMAP family member 4-like n=1 Tax=Mytilus edulis TaxID=6550 RepID=UPI0039EE48CF